MIGQATQGGTPVTDAYTPADLSATVFHLMGVGPETRFDQQGRPYRLTEEADNGASGLSGS